MQEDQLHILRHLLKAGRIYEVLKQYLRALPVLSPVFRLWSHSPIHCPLKGDDLTPAARHLPLRRHSKAGNRGLSLFDHLQQQKNEMFMFWHKTTRGHFK